MKPARREVAFQVRLSVREKKLVNRLAKDRGVSASALVRQLVREEAARCEGGK